MIKTHDLTLNTSNAIGTADQFGTSFTWNSINLRVLMGDLYDRFDRFNLCLNTIATTTLNNGTFAKLTIKDDMRITLNYTINLRKNINWKEIDDNINDITKYCNSYLNHKLNFNEISIKANFTIEIENVSMQNLKKKIRSYYPPLN